MLLYALIMRFSGISLIFLPAIEGETQGLFSHIVVSIGFCEDAGRCNTQIFSIAFDNTSVRKKLTFIG